MFREEQTGLGVKASGPDRVGSRAPGRTPGRCVVTARSTQGPAVPDGGDNLEGQVCPPLPPTVTELPPRASPGQGVKVLLVGDVRMGGGTRTGVAAHPQEHLLGGSCVPDLSLGAGPHAAAHELWGLFLCHQLAVWFLDKPLDLHVLI